ncbi:RBBP9/YdeN family alpha/beta hydrolase [Humibacter ginsenosidimutans]|uniref:Serine hydrolase family protein n=1 Tax=Humibacter ginsenosidimutans TaxID=2599293 RepID=A0A5B8M2V9_9MICO|nr:alpha/beta hydrolase [Humibacter ginsenosidimutans]QDZ14062.1 serine hydrolase family protein [Humibacter ginsenosidimutans]
MRIVIVRGIDDSPHDHWQSIWQKSLGPAAVRIAPASFTEPDEDDWCAAINAITGEDDILVAHSLGCLAAASWIARGGRAAGAFLVAPPDENGSAFPPAAHGFTAPHSALQVPSVIVASDDDPYCSPAHLTELSTMWGSPKIDVGQHGHLNRASRLGEWDEGQRLLTAFAAGLGVRLPGV